MEPISITAITLAIWEYSVNPVVKSIEKEYSEVVKKKLKSGLGKILTKFSFNKNEREVIEAEIINTNVENLIDKEHFLEFLKNNKQIRDIFIEVKNRNKNINISVEKGVGYIEKNYGDINF